MVNPCAIYAIGGVKNVAKGLQAKLGSHLYFRSYPDLKENKSQHIDLWGDERFFFAGVIGWLYLLHEDEKHNLSLQDNISGLES